MDVKAYRQYYINYLLYTIWMYTNRSRVETCYSFIILSWQPLDIWELLQFFVFAVKWKMSEVHYFEV